MTKSRIFGVALSVAAAVTVAAPGNSSEPEPPGPKARCPVCGMFVAKYPNWIATIRFDDGTRVFFDGPKDMFRYVLDPDTYRPGSTVEDIEEIVVTDYYSTECIDARRAFFVVGTDVMGPMGHELVPTRTRSDAETLITDHGGGKILVFDEVNADEIP